MAGSTTSGRRKSPSGPLTSAKPAPRIAGQRSWLGRLLQDHVRAMEFSLAALRRRPVGTALTAFVIGITLALPAGLQTLISNLGDASGNLRGSLRASLYLKDSVTPERGAALMQELARRPEVKEARYISREQALQEFRSYSGFGEALDLIKDNPLPAAIVLTPDSAQPQERVQALLKDLAGLPEVERAQLDEKWVQRLYAIIELVQRGVLLVAAALALAGLVVVANTIRLDIENRREEIEVMKLIGAGNGYIRRPFLYTGLWYGLAGAVLACALVQGAILALAGPASRLASLYDSTISLAGLQLEAVGAVFGAGVALGWLGAFWAVSRHLRHIEPA
jgi:cell division transport system permease protein